MANKKNARIEVLKIVKNRPKINNSKVSEIYGTSPSHTHVILSWLVRADLISKKIDSLDKKRKLYSIKDAGEKALLEVR